MGGTRCYTVFMMSLQPNSPCVLSERRLRRGQSRRESVVLQLRATAKRLGAHALMLIDGQGRVLARSSRLPADAEVARLGSRLANDEFWMGEIEVNGECQSVFVSPMHLAPDTVAYLCAVGANARGFGAAMLHTAAGVRRIMKL